MCSTVYTVCVGSLTVCTVALCAVYVRLNCVHSGVWWFFNCLQCVQQCVCVRLKSVHSGV